MNLIAAVANRHSPDKGSARCNTCACLRRPRGIRLTHRNTVKRNAHALGRHHRLSCAQALADLDKAQINKHISVLKNFNQNAADIISVSVCTNTRSAHGRRYAYTSAYSPFRILVLLLILGILTLIIQFLDRFLHAGADADFVEVQLVSARAHVTGRQQIPSPHLKRSDSNLLSHHVDRVFQCKNRLRRSKSAHGTRMIVVCHDHFAVIVQTIHPIRPRTKR